MEYPSAITTMGPTDRRGEFNPYVDNGGTVVAIAGTNFCLLGGDTRVSQGYTILSRNTSKITQLTRTAAIATAGMKSDISRFHKMLLIRVKEYEYKLHKEPSVEALAFLISKELYSKRFFPYYTFNLLGGLDDKGVGIIYGYDAIGSFDKVCYGAMGSGSQLVVPVMDNQLKGHNWIKEQPCESLEKAKNMMLDIMNSCAERDIYTGDQLELVTVSAQGTATEYSPLRAD